MNRCPIIRYTHPVKRFMIMVLVTVREVGAVDYWVKVYMEIMLGLGKWKRRAIGEGGEALGLATRESANWVGAGKMDGVATWMSTGEGVCAV